MEINQTVSQITSREQSDDEFESFIEGMCICNSFLTLCLFSVLENQYQNL
jgi:hypothetical protein